MNSRNLLAISPAHARPTEPCEICAATTHTAGHAAILTVTPNHAQPWQMLVCADCAALLAGIPARRPHGRPAGGPPGTAEQP